jgi:hypothetical protein
MKRELALQLLQTTMPGLADESSAARLFRELQLLAEYKYNKYEMYHPGRLFLENLYLWLQQFAENEREDALAFVRSQLIFVSREEFQQLAQVLYNDRIRRQQFAIAADRAGIPKHRIQAIRDSQSFARTTRASLYVGMSDGARLDFIRRHNLTLNNEQVLPYYAVHKEKVDDCLHTLRGEVNDSEARFRCLFLIDDFAGSGNTLLREVVTAGPLPATWKPPEIPARWKARLRFKGAPVMVEFVYRGAVSDSEIEDLCALDSHDSYRTSIQTIAEKSAKRETVLKGSLCKVAAGDIGAALEPNAAVFFCPLLTTEYALNRLTPLLPRLPKQFAHTQILPGAALDSQVAIVDGTTPMGELCERYYDESLGDEHTGSVKFGYDGCGLPLVLHHNTPNNSLFLLWARRSKNVAPLFVRYERHGREGL